MAKWQSLNYDQPIPEVDKAFSITCPKGTDIFDKPPSTHRFDAPIVYTTTTVSRFKSATITVRGDWQQKYDQGGLIIIMNLSDGSRKWMKTGIEFLDGTPLISVVTKDRWADWSLRPLLDSDSGAARIHIETHDDGSLWVYLLGEGGQKYPVREVTWWGELDAGTQVHVGPAAAKPSTAGGDLVVDFDNFELVLA